MFGCFVNLWEVEGFLSLGCTGWLLLHRSLRFFLKNCGLQIISVPVLHPIYFCVQQFHRSKCCRALTEPDARRVVVQAVFRSSPSSSSPTHTHTHTTPPRTYVNVALVTRLAWQARGATPPRAHVAPREVLTSLACRGGSGT
jgi:hypothetical protein